jgi:hypothetical protein
VRGISGAVSDLPSLNYTNRTNRPESGKRRPAGCGGPQSSELVSPNSFDFGLSNQGGTNTNGLETGVEAPNTVEITQMLAAAIANSAGVPGSRVISLRRTSREIPSFFILAINVVRLSPSRVAAP